VPHAIRKKRTRLLIEAGDRVRQKLFNHLVERQFTASVLVEKQDPEKTQWSTGRSAEYLPITIQGSSIKPGNLINVQITGTDGTRLIARPV
jgi:tRNA A37 methylthiotransferase MiaB